MVLAEHSETPTARLWERLLPARWAIASATALVVFCGVWLGLRVVLPGDGAVWKPDGGFKGGITLGATSDGAGSALKAGDVVVRVNGVPLDRWLGHPSPVRPPLASGETLIYQVRRHDGAHDVTVVVGRAEPIGRWLRHEGAVGLAAGALIALAGFVVARRPEHPAARALLLFGAGLAVTFTFNTVGFEAVDVVAAPWLLLAGLGGQIAGTAVMVLSLAYLVVAFPSPPGIFQRRPRLIGSLYGVGLVPAVGVLGYVLAGHATIAGLHRWDVVSSSMYRAVAVVLVAGVVRIAVLARRDPAVRRQVALVGVALGALVIGVILLNVFWPNTQAPPLVVAGLFVPLPTAVAVALLRGELLDIRATLNRALSFTALSSALVAVYAAVVALVALLAGSTGLVASLPATAAVAVAFAPIRDRSQRVAERLFYGDRGQPARVLNALGQRLETAIAPDEVLPAIAETVASALRLPYIAIANDLGSGRLACERGQRPATTVTVPLVHQGEAVGQLIVGPRPGEHGLAAADRALLGDIARQVAATMRATALLTDLTASRKSIVVAREEERTQLRHDLHDRLGARLAGLALRLDTTATAVDGSPLADSIHRASAEVDAALTEVRRLARGLRPADLDELGLVAAVEAAATRLTVSDDAARWRTDISAAVHLPALGSDIEAAAFHIALEAMTNAQRHSGGTHAQVRIGMDQSGTVLVLDVADDGDGMSTAGGSGVGLSSMSRRATAVGGTLSVGASEAGGTQVHAELPLIPHLRGRQIRADGFTGDDGARRRRAREHPVTCRDPHCAIARKSSSHRSPRRPPSGAGPEE